MRYSSALITLIILLSDDLHDIVVETVDVDCSQLRVGQYLCPDPEVDFIDPKTQQPYGCTKENVAKIWCVAAEGLNCIETKNTSFRGQVPCKWT